VGFTSAIKRGGSRPVIPNTPARSALCDSVVHRRVAAAYAMGTVARRGIFPTFQGRAGLLTCAPDCPPGLFLQGVEQ
jgi:hypothetical protein